MLRGGTDTIQLADQGIEFRTFSQFLSATIGPAVARVSAPSTIPSLKRQPTIVVPVLVAFGIFTPLLSRKALLSERFKQRR